MPGAFGLTTNVEIGMIIQPKKKPEKKKKKTSNNRKNVTPAVKSKLVEPSSSTQPNPPAQSLTVQIPTNPLQKSPTSNNKQEITFVNEEDIVWIKNYEE